VSNERTEYHLDVKHFVTRHMDGWYTNVIHVGGWEDVNVAESIFFLFFFPFFSCRLLFIKLKLKLYILYNNHIARG
jgi:hypothetical protein